MTPTRREYITPTPDLFYHCIRSTCDHVQNLQQSKNYMRKKQPAACAGIFFPVRSVLVM